MLYNLLTCILTFNEDIPAIIVTRRRDVMNNEQSSSESRMSKQEKIMEMRNILRAITRPHRYSKVHSNLKETDNKLDTGSFFPFIDMLRSKEEAENKAKETENGKIDKETKNDRRKKNKLSKSEEENVKLHSKNIMSDIKKNVGSKKTQGIFKKLFYVVFVITAVVIAYQMGKRAESENYLRVLQPDQ